MATIRRLKSGTYQAILTITGGKRISATGKSQDEALKAVFKLADNPITSTRSKSPKSPNPTQQITVGDAIDRYINSKCLILSPSTIQSYKWMRDARFKSLMCMPLSGLNAEVLQLAVNAEAAEVSPKTVKNAYGLITSAVGMIAPDIKLTVTLPRKAKKDIYVPDADEVARIYQMVVGYDNGKLIKPFLLATQCGLRASEIAGLRKECVNEDSIVINQSMIYTHDMGNVIKQPKSASGYRTIPISPTLSKTILTGCKEGDLVYDSSSHYITSLWIRFRKKYDLPQHLNFHALRHHFASQCLLQGIPQKYIANMMGHSGTKMIEQVYQHIFPSALAEYGKKLAENTDLLLNCDGCDGRCDG